MGFFKTGAQLVKSLFTSPVTNSYPRGGAHIVDGARGAIAIDETMCTLCGLCGRRCPSGALVIKRDEGCWLIDRMKCIVCGECVYECPENCLEMVKEYVSPESSVVIDVFNAQAKPGSDSVLDGIESMPEEHERSGGNPGTCQRMREIQRRRRRRRGRETINKGKKNNRAFHRNRSRQ